MDISVIIPAYQEKENLEILLPKLKGVLTGLGIQYEILVVDTLEKMDATDEVCRRNQVTYLNRVNGNSYGDAIRTGTGRSSGAKVLIMDADGSHEPESIKEMYSCAVQYDLVIGSRYIKDGRTENNLILILMSLMVNIMYRMLLRLKVRDVSNSFRIYDGEKLRSIESICNNFDLVEELLIKLVLRYPELTVKEVPIEFKKRLYGKSKRDLIKFVMSYLVTMRRLIKIKNSYRKK
ncbi:MAG TPA: glycosyltransferase [Bacillota bacterium]|nr:glycosyltransferase [Bacillota bacterium]